MEEERVGVGTYNRGRVGSVAEKRGGGVDR